MSRGLNWLCVLLVASLVACAGGGASSEASDPPPKVATAIIETDQGPVVFEVEVAETQEQRARGLMGRKSLPPDSGMLFIYFEESTGGFWMKNTLIPLSIAFFDQQGRILRILDMEPCRSDPCKIYDPGVAYWGALEVNQGRFDERGVSEGDVIHTNQ